MGGAPGDSGLGGAAAEEGRARGRRRGRARPGSGRHCRRDGGGRGEGLNPRGQRCEPPRDPLIALRLRAAVTPPRGPARLCSRHRDRAARHGAEAGPGGAAVAPAPHRAHHPLWGRGRRRDSPRRPEEPPPRPRSR